MPSWSPDGQSIVFVGSLDNDLAGHGLGWEGSIPMNALYRMDVNGKNLVRLTHESQENIMWYSWMP